MPLLPGTRLGPYEIVDLVGTGGMGEVYRATDTRLSRRVAVKVLALLAKDGRQRFEREARAISSLSHPHICALYDVGQQDDVDFIVMEYLEGETLAARLGRGPLPLADALRYGVEIAEGLDEAHRHGVVHRDLKPANVMLTRNGAKLLDFGVAKWVPRPGPLDESISDRATNSRDLTGEGAMVGTLQYMAPEQLHGRATDARTDLFALGSILFEMASGQRAFVADTSAGLIRAILADEPPLAGEASDRVPPGLQHIIRRCLAKDPDQRWQTAHDLAAELTWLRQGGDLATGSRPPPATAEGDGGRSRSRSDPNRRRALVLAGLVLVAVALAALLHLSGRLSGRHREKASGMAAIASLAVLPLANVSGDPDQAYFVDGMTDALITGLSRMGVSRVISRTSVMSYRGTHKQLPQIGRELNVDAIVEGSVSRTGDHVRISAQLIEVATDEHLWADSYERDLRDVFALQAEVAGAVTQGIRGRLEPVDPTHRHPIRVADPRAYELYLKGRYSWNQYTEEGWKTAIGYFDQAIAIDPSYAPAWAGLADSYYQLSSLVLRPDEAIPKARTAALRALQIDDELAEAHASLGIIKSQYDWDRAGAEKEFRRAIALDSNYATAHQWLGMYYFAGGRFDDALVSFERARQVDPLSLFISITAVWPLANLGRYEEAIRQVERIVAMHPDVTVAKEYLHDLRGEMYERDHRYDAAVAEMLQGYWTSALCGDSPEVKAALRRAYALAGMPGYRHKQLELAKKKYAADVQAATKRSPPPYVSPYRLAELHARVGERDQAFEVLEQCIRSRDESLLWLKAESLKDNSPWEGIRSDPRFADVLRRIGLAT